MDLEPLNFLNEKSIRRVFRDWHSLKALGQHPLARLTIVEIRRQEAGFADSSTDRGLALQKVFQAAIEALKPDNGSPNPRERHWRPYIILTSQFLRCLSPEVVRAQLFVSRGTYYGEQKRALEMLVAVLQKQENGFFWPSEPVSAQRQRLAPFMVPPRPVHRLLGRDRCLQEIKAALLQGEDRAITALRGLPGVGKTTLAVELAYDPEIRQHFEDGILWAGLGRQPAPLSLLSAWADALCIPANIVASRASLAGRAALLRAQIGMRSMLLIIDDAWQIEAALALKVGGPKCAHLVTTRLPDVALGFASSNVVQIHELSLEEGLNLLEEISPRAVAADRDQAQKLVQAVGSLPLALILMGKYLQKQSDSSQIRRLQDALQKLQTAEVRLQLNQLRSPLESDPNFPFTTPLSLQAAIGLSDAALDPAAHSALLNLSLFPPKPSTFSEEAALAVIAAPPEILDALVDGGLLETSAPERYTLHQTITDYAALQGAGATASRQLVDYFTDLVAAAAQNFNLLDREVTNIFAACELALQLHQPAAFVRLVLALYPFLETRGLYGLAERYLQNACTAANELDDRVSQAAILSKLGDFEVKRGRFKTAQFFLERSLALVLEAGSRENEGDTLFNLGLACAYRGEVITGRRHLENCLSVHREFHNEKAEAYALNALGFTLQELGRYSEAKTLLQEALEQSIKTGERRNEGWVHYNLGQVCFSLGEFARAKDHNEQCLQIYRALGDQRGEGWIVFEKGRVFRQTGEYRQAESFFSQALMLLGGLGDTMGEGYSVLNLGLIQMDLGNPAAAEAYFQQALTKFTQIECRTGESQAYHLLGTLYRRNGDFIGARSLLEKSLQLYQVIPYKRGECTHLANLALTESHLGCAAAALEHACEALCIAEEIQAPPTQAYILTCLGQVLLEVSRFEAAEAVFTQALSIDRRLGQDHLAIEPLAGLAEIALRRGDLSQAKLWVEELISALEERIVLPGLPDFLPRIEQPARVYLTCFHILDAIQDPQAEAILRSAGGCLQAWAASLTAPGQRSLFLELPEHREILARLAEG